MTPAHSTTSNALADPHGALASLLDLLQPVNADTIALDDAAGRILAYPVEADRPSPACDVSAMDGYAIRRRDLTLGRLPISGEVAMGQAPPTLPPQSAVRIFTGGAVPGEADAVVRRESVTEHTDAIEFDPAMKIAEGANIRRRGENIEAGQPVVAAGQSITPAVAAALANFGVVQPPVHRPVRLTILTTGNELLPPSAEPEPWQLRDSNTQTLRDLFAPSPWVELVSARRVSDELAELTQSLEAALQESDAVIFTGGVSMGDHDHVPRAVEQAGGKTVFHKLGIRPGKPMLGAIGPRGQAILGLPGNPVSVMVTARRFALPVLRKLAGWCEPDPAAPTVTVTSPDERSLNLWWYRPVRLTEHGQCELVASKGSGDLVATVASDGFIELPPGGSGQGPWPFYLWAIGTRA